MMDCPRILMVETRVRPSFAWCDLEWVRRPSRRPCGSRMKARPDVVDARPAVARLGTVACSFAVSLWLLTLCGSFNAHAHGDADHDHGPPTASVAGSMPRLATKSEAYELVAILDGERLTVYLDRFEDNSPVSDAKITVTIDGESVAVEPAAGSTFAVSSKRFGGHGSVELIFDIRAPGGDDLLIGGRGNDIDVCLVQQRSLASRDIRAA